MRFTPKTEKEIAEDNLLPEGEYPFQISAGEDTTSKSGNDMIKLLVRVYKPDGNFFLINDYLLESMAFKLRHACEACGLLDRYETGELQGSDFIGCEGKLKLVIAKSKDPQYSDRNAIKDYIVSKDKVPSKVDMAIKSMAPVNMDDLSDTIPF